MHLQLNKEKESRFRLSNSSKGFLYELRSSSICNITEAIAKCNSLFFAENHRFNKRLQDTSWEMPWGQSTKIAAETTS